MVTLGNYDPAAGGAPDQYSPNGTYDFARGDLDISDNATNVWGDVTRIDVSNWDDYV